MNTHTHYRGFTLIEVVLALAVASGVTLAIFSSFGLIDTIRSRQEGAGIVAWEGSLILHRLQVLMSAGIVSPGAQAMSPELILSDGGVIGEQNGTLVLTQGTDVVVLSTAKVRIASLQFRDDGTASSSGLLHVSFMLSTLASDSRASFEQVFNATLYDN